MDTGTLETCPTKNSYALRLAARVAPQFVHGGRAQLTHRRDVAIRDRRQFGLHPLAVEDALNPVQSPKVEVYGRQLFIVARTAAFEDIPQAITDLADRGTTGRTVVLLP